MTDKLPDNAIEMVGLNKVYGSKKGGDKHALADVNLAVPRGSIFGLLGPNGAGKSTMINILAGLVNKTAGDVRVWGHDLDKAERMAKSSIGIVPQEVSTDFFFTPRESLDVQAGFYGVPKAERRTEELLDFVSLSDKADNSVRALSGGMKRRLMIAKAMVHSPPILVLDEPTAGVDIELRRQLWKNVRLLNDEGVTIVLTTHYLEEAEELCDKIAIINHGKIVACEDKDALVNRIDAKEVRFRLDRAFDIVPDTLAALGGQKNGERSIVFSYSPSEVAVGQYITAVQAAGFGIADVFTQDSDLEDVFLQLTRD